MEYTEFFSYAKFFSWVFPEKKIFTFFILQI